MTERQRLDPDPLYIDDAGEEPWLVPGHAEESRRLSSLLVPVIVILMVLIAVAAGASGR